MDRYRKFFSSVAATTDRESVDDDAYEEVSIVGDYLVTNPQKSYVLDVVGDSMEDEGIFDGTLLIVEEYSDPFKTPIKGQIIVAAVGK